MDRYVSYISYVGFSKMSKTNRLVHMNIIIIAMPDF